MKTARKMACQATPLGADSSGVPRSEQWVVGETGQRGTALQNGKVEFFFLAASGDPVAASSTLALKPSLG